MDISFTSDDDDGIDSERYYDTNKSKLGLRSASNHNSKTIEYPKSGGGYSHLRIKNH